MLGRVVTGLTVAAIVAAAASAQEVKVAGPDFGRYHALVIGNNDNEHLRKMQNAVADAEAVTALFEEVAAALGPPDLVVYNSGAFRPGSVLEIEARDFETCWRIGCLGGFLVGQQAARIMAERGHGSIIFTGATASLRGGANFANLAVGKFGLRALTQSLARELGPRGVHVAHVIIDGQIRSERYAQLEKERPADAFLDPAAIAEAYYQLHRQPRSAWTQELDLRPWVEKF